MGGGGVRDGGGEGMYLLRLSGASLKLRRMRLGPVQCEGLMWGEVRC